MRREIPSKVREEKNKTLPNQKPSAQSRGTNSSYKAFLFDRLGGILKGNVEAVKADVSTWGQANHFQSIDVFGRGNFDPIILHVDNPHVV